MTGWGQHGPLAERAGHDIDYIALSGVLHAIGHAGDRPVPPLNLVADFGGGGMLLAFGVCAGLVEARCSGKGQVIDAAMFEGASLLATMHHGMVAAGQWQEERGVNLLDSGAPWYDTYETSDGRFVAIGAIEPKFYQELLERLGLANAQLPSQHDRAGWPVLRKRFAEVFLTRTRDEWSRVFVASDACFAPVLTFAEARSHPYHTSRASHVEVEGIHQPAPAPRFSRTPGEVRRPPPERGALGREALSDWGFGAAEIEKLRALGLGFA
jgi:alpha-methylacyl-CoA racemase